MDGDGEPSSPKPIPKPIPKPTKKKGKKKAGGIQIPADWPWEEARTMFSSPEVTPASEVEVGYSLHVHKSLLMRRAVLVGMDAT